MAQIYAYLYPGSLQRVIQIGVNTPGHFLYDRETLDEMMDDYIKFSVLSQN